MSTNSPFWDRSFGSLARCHPRVRRARAGCLHTQLVRTRMGMLSFRPFTKFSANEMAGRRGGGAWGRKGAIPKGEEWDSEEMPEGTPRRSTPYFKAHGRLRRGGGRGRRPHPARRRGDVRRDRGAHSAAARPAAARQLAMALKRQHPDTWRVAPILPGGLRSGYPHLGFKNPAENPFPHGMVEELTRTRSAATNRHAVCQDPDTRPTLPTAQHHRASHVRWLAGCMWSSLRLRILPDSLACALIVCMGGAALSPIADVDRSHPDVYREVLYDGRYHTTSFLLFRGNASGWDFAAAQCPWLVTDGFSEHAAYVHARPPTDGNLSNQPHRDFWIAVLPPPPRTERARAPRMTPYVLLDARLSVPSC